MSSPTLSTSLLKAHSNVQCSPTHFTLQYASRFTNAAMNVDIPLLRDVVPVSTNRSIVERSWSVYRMWLPAVAGGSDFGPANKLVNFIPMSKLLTGGTRVRRTRSPPGFEESDVHQT
jgi:hypothetical protein